MIYFGVEDRYALMAMPGCRVTPLPDMPKPLGRAGIQVAPTGARLLRFYPPSQAGATVATVANESPYLYAYSPAPSAIPLMVPAHFFPEKRDYPLLSEDGGWLAVLRTVRTPAENRNEIFLRNAVSGASRTFWPRAIEISWHELVAIDVAKEEIVLARGQREYLWAGFDGKPIRGPVHTGEVQAQPLTFRWVGDGWFAWDAYRDHAPYGFRLKTSGVDRYTATEKLRHFKHAAISPDTRHAAMSLETEHGRLLWLRDAVTVSDIASGREIFRRYLPRFTRSQVAFLDSDYFAYSEPGRVRVLRLPQSQAAK